MLVPDFDYYPISHAVRDCQITHAGRCLHIVWDDGREDDYHVHLLRENAPDEDIIHPITREVAVMLNNIDEDLKIASAEITNEGIALQWSDNQKHNFHIGWLRAWKDEAFFALPKRVLWGKDFQPPRHDYKAINEDLKARLAWLEDFFRYGTAIVTNSPADPSVIESLPTSIGAIRGTNFGTLFDVELKHENADSNAYTSLPLPLHVDLATREYQPGLQFLHCLINTTDGGFSTLMDGFMMVQELKKSHPKEYKLLTTKPVIQATKAKTSDYRWTAPTIICDDAGEPIEVRYNPWLRAPIDYDFATTDAIYKALRVLYNFAESDRFKINFRLESGDMLCFDNRRVMHGRTGFSSDKGERHLRGCYMEREELESGIRMTQRRIRATELGLDYPI